MYKSKKYIYHKKKKKLIFQSVNIYILKFKNFIHLLILV